MTTQAVIERYFELSTSNNAHAVIDCFAKVWRDKHDTNPTFADSAGRWSQAGPASGLVITFLDTVNGCDRFRVSADGGLRNEQRIQRGAVHHDRTGGRCAEDLRSGHGVVNPQIATTTCK